MSKNLVLILTLFISKGFPMQTEDYGYWKSPFSAEVVAAGSKRLGAIAIDGQDVYWEENRPQEGGRTVIVCKSSDGKFKEITPQGFNVRTRVHEYGGASFAVKNGVIYFVNNRDQRVYIQNKEEVRPLTEEGPRFADLLITPKGLIAIGELHNESDVENFLALIDLKSGSYQRIASGNDFYSSPALSQDEKKLAWLSWNHPNMPWNATELYVDGKKIAGSKDESIFQPQWSPDNQLYYISDKEGFWNLYQGGKNLYPMKAEWGLPQWVFGMSTYAFIGDKILCAYTQEGVWSLALFDLKEKKLKDLDFGGTYYTQIRATSHFAVFLMGSPKEKRRIVKWNPKTNHLTTLTETENLSIDPHFISIGQPINYPSKEGRVAHAFYYPPTNPDFTAPAGTLPPLLVKCHGGPTAASNNVLDLSTQFWTSRGFAVLDVNYGGSTGYGKAYQELLDGKWGIVDVEDCEAGANFLIKQGLVDPKKIAITGGSAGGYTTLRALMLGSPFVVGASYFGVSDLEAMVKDTHKAEARYFDRLIGPYPQDEAYYKELSPISSAGKIQRPVIFFQGSEDKVVPPNQSEMMYNALKKKGIKTELIIYQGEQHGFRKAENIQDSLERELNFYLQVFK